MPVTKRVLFHGTVQGVNFRRNTRNAALERGVEGWVRNLPDGSVEAEFSGDEEAVDSLLSYCRKGLPGARVEHVEISNMDYMRYDGFEVRY